MTTLSATRNKTLNRPPGVLVVARYRQPGDLGRIAQSLSLQTCGETELLFVLDPKAGPPGSNAGVDICTEATFAAHLAKSSASHVLFWPDEGDLKPAAMEKLLLALEVSPDQHGVGDCSHAGTGLWLARRGGAMDQLIALWAGPQVKWIGECLARKPEIFSIPENLSASTEPASLRRPYAVEHLFGKHLGGFENYQQIPIAPLWPLPEAGVDDRSVLFVVTCLQIGGATKFLLDVTAQLKAQGYRVTIATTGYENRALHPWLDELLAIVPDVFVLTHTRLAEMPRQIVHLARSRRCGRLVLSHSLLGYQLLPWLRSELPAVSFLDYTHIEYEAECPNGGYALRSVANQPLLDLSLVSSAHLRDWMVGHGAEHDNLRVCHTNIDAAKWTPDPVARAHERSDLGLDARTALILYPCRLSEQKRPELMCNIVAELRRATRSPFVVVVAGDGELMPALQHFIEQQGLEDSFRLLGAVSLERMAHLHNAADILLLPSLIEGIALALFEAMALESVPVVSDVGGQRELLTPECGYLIPLGDPRREVAEYVAALKHLVENPGACRIMSVACRARVRDHFHLGQMTATFITALDEAGLRHDLCAPLLPAPAVCREMATMAVDYVRLKFQGRVEQDHRHLLQDQMAAQTKVIAKLQRQLEMARVERLIPEENEAHL